MGCWGSNGKRQEAIAIQAGDCDVGSGEETVLVTLQEWTSGDVAD